MSIFRAQQELTDLAQLATLLTMFSDDEEPDERLKDVYDEILGLNRRIQELVCNNK